MGTARCPGVANFVVQTERPSAFAVKMASKEVARKYDGEFLSELEPKNGAQGICERSRLRQLRSSQRRGLQVGRIFERARRVRRSVTAPGFGCTEDKMPPPKSASVIGGKKPWIFFAGFLKTKGSSRFHVQVSDTWRRCSISRRTQ